MNAIVGVSIGVAALAVFSLAVTCEDKKAREAERGWRIRWIAAGRLLYEERKDGAWVGVSFEEISDYRESPHIIDIRRVDRWSEFPAWAAGRREEIVSRMKLELSGPQYVFREA